MLEKSVMPRPVRMVDYDPRWPKLYDDEKRRIREHVGNKAVVIEHIGSTAVPRLGGKPIIDVMAGVRLSADADACVSRLYDDYKDVTPEPDNPEGYYCLGKPCQSDTGYDVHLHLVKYLSDHWARHLFFRDFLRMHPDVTQQYYVLKKKLATQYGSDRVGYTDAKTSFINAIIDQASRREGRLDG
jgi:GrpB-like predicted nucleotidyltransferase (UPF0157 family)